MVCKTCKIAPYFGVPSEKPYATRSLQGNYFSVFPTKKGTIFQNIFSKDTVLAPSFFLSE